MTYVPRRLCIALSCGLLAVLSRCAATAGEMQATIFVPVAAIYPGDVIASQSLIERQVRGVPQLGPRFGSRKEDLVGKVARRTLIPGQPIPESAVRTHDTVIQGHSYDILYRSGALTVSGVAVPLKSAAAGETVNVRNSETGLVVQATVQAGGTLLVQSR
jgi:flagellar basal body P-ring formation protein FlgA